MKNLYALLCLLMVISCSDDEDTKFNGRNDVEKAQLQIDTVNIEYGNEATALEQSNGADVTVAGASSEASEKTEKVSEKARPSGVTLSDSIPVGLSLASVAEYTYVVTVPEGFVGDVGLTLDVADFSSIDPSGDAIFTVDPEVLRFDGAGSQEVRLTVDVGTMSPSVSEEDEAGHFRLIATSGGEELAATDIGLSIEPLIVIEMYGGGNVEMSYVPDLREMNFSVHEDGLLVRFVNMDENVGNVVHSGGAIPHGPRNSPMAAASGDEPGGTYEVMIDVDDNSARWYSHSYGGVKTTMNFNIP